MQNRKVRVKVPASTANLGPGFDTLGMALELYAWIEMGIAEQTKFELHGDQMKGIPTTKDNLIYQVAQQVFDAAGVAHPELEIAMYSDIPLARGLGSSAAAIVGALFAANELIGNRLSQDELFQLATKLEKHPDNVGACLFGGIIASSFDGKDAQYIRISPPDRLEALVAIPDFQLSTEKARQAIPRTIPLENAVFNVSHTAMLVAALCQGELSQISEAMRDTLHQPYRAKLIPGMEEVLEEAVAHGALGVALSGAGPTILTLVDSESQRKKELEEFLLKTLQKENISVQLLWLKPCLKGAQLLTHYDENSTFIENIKGEVRA